MSHSTVTFSPPGTPLTDRTVGELVAERPGRSRIFQEWGIDFCCQGGRPLREACQRRGVAVETVAARLEAELAGDGAPEVDPQALPPHELAAHIVRKHHAFLVRELPRLHEMAERVARVHGGHTPSLKEVFAVFRSMEEELHSHMMKEEQVLFPAIAAMSRGESPPQPLDGPIACMMHEHDEVGNSLAALRELTGGYLPSDRACNTWRALFAGLAELDQDLRRHIHLENDILFPAAQAMVASAA